MNLRVGRSRKAAAARARTMERLDACPEPGTRQIAIAIDSPSPSEGPLSEEPKPTRASALTRGGWLLLLAGLLLMGACQCPSADRFDRARVEAEVRDAMRRFEAFEKERSVEGLLSFLDPEFGMLQDGQRVDHEATVRQMKTTLPTLQSFEPRFDDVEIRVLGRDLALTSMIFHDEITSADGTVTRMWGPSTLLWRRSEDGQWRILFGDSDHYPEPESASR